MLELRKGYFSNGILYGYILIYLLIVSEFFGFYRNTSLSDSLGVNDFMYVGVIVLTLFATILTGRLSIPVATSANAQLVPYLFLIIVIADFIASKLRFNQSFSQIISVSYLYLVVPFVMFFLYMQIETLQDCDEIEDMIIRFASVLAALSTIQFVLGYANITIFEAVIGERYGSIRMGIGTPLQIIGIFMSYTKWRNYKGTKYLIPTILLAFSIIFVVKTRALYIYIGAALAFFEIQKRSRNIKRWTVLLGLLAVSLIIFEMVQEEGALVTLDSGDSHVIWRMRTAKLYFDEIVDSPVFGLGFIKAIEGTESYDLLMGSWGRAFRGDVGLLGFVNTFGLCGLAWFIYVIQQFVKKTGKLMSFGLTDQAAPYLCYLFFAIIGSVTYSIFANSTLVVFPLMMSLLIKRENLNTELQEVAEE